MTLAGRIAPQPLNEEAPFKFEELFFSRTDERGIILSGNSVFQRISMYEWEGLLKKPHNLIRHPDMPKAVFWLLWDTLKRGEPIGAYVKNMARNGRYYWVFAVVTPVDGGYLSVRLKPSSPIFEVVEQEYKALLLREQEEGLTPAESGAILLARLAELGFPDYSSFMATALSKEIAARNAQMGRSYDRVMGYFDDLTEAAQAVLKHSGIIFSSYEQNQYVPLNLQVQSAQMQDAGTAISVISSNYNIISTEIKNNMEQFLTSVQQVARTISQGLFLVCTATLQKELITFFENEPPSEHVSRSAEMKLLAQQRETYEKKALAGLQAIRHQTERFQQNCRDMKMLAAGLEVTRVMGKVECARQLSPRDGLSEMINELGALQEPIADSLREINNVTGAINFSTERLVSELSTEKLAKAS
jgi:hypothetical protein